MTRSTSYNLHSDGFYSGIVPTILGETFHHNRSWKNSPFKVPIKLHHIYLSENDANKLDPAEDRHPCSISVSHLSVFISH